MALQGQGTAENPYLIGTPEDFNQVRNNLSAHYRQVADIDFGGQNFSPIGENGTNWSNFSGVYDGQGYKISNMNIVGSNRHTALFASLGGSNSNRAIIKNLEIENISVINNSKDSIKCEAVVASAVARYSDIESIMITNCSLNGTGLFVQGVLIADGAGDSMSVNIINNVLVRDVYMSGATNAGGIAGIVARYRLQNTLSFLSDDTPSNIPSVVGTGTSDVRFYNVGGGYDKTSRSLGNTSTSMGRRPYNLRNRGKMLSEYTLTNSSYGWNDVEIWDFGVNNDWNMIDGEYPYMTFAGYNPNKAIKLSVEDDLEYIRNKPDAFFKLVNDIPIGYKSRQSYILDIDFTGDLNGDGYWFTDIDIDNPTSTSINYSFFRTISGKIYNIGFRYKNMFNRNRGKSVDDDPHSSLICWYLYGTISNVSVIVEGNNQSSRHHGLIGYIFDDAILEDTYFEADEIRAGGNPNTYGQSFLKVWGASNGRNYTIRRNIANIRFLTSESGSRYDQELFGRGDNVIVSDITISDNIIYTPDTTRRIWIHSGITRASYLSSQFQNPNWSAYNNFNKEEIWLFEQDDNPKLRTFYKIVAKIEERLVESYSRIIKGFNNRFIGRFEKLISFSKTIKSKLNSKKIKFSNVSSFIKPLYTKTISEKLKLNNVKSFSKPMKSRVSRIKSSVRDVLTYSKAYASNLLNKKKSNKTANTFINKIYATSFVDMISKTLKKVKSFSRNINSKLYNTKIARKIIAGFSKGFKSNLLKHRVTSTIVKAISKPFTSKLFKYVNKNMKVKSFSREFFGKSLSELARKRIRQVVSFSRAMRSRIWRFSNKFQFVIVTVKGGMKAIIGNVDRFATIKRFVKSRTKKLTSWASMFYRVASPQEVYAFIKATFRKVKLFKRENEIIMNIKKHKTKIDKSDK